MKIIISPAKTMNKDTDTYPVTSLPVFLDQTKKIYEKIRTMTREELQKLWKCNDKLADLNYERFLTMDLEKDLTPAILAYEGLQYQHMAPIVFEEQAIDYVKKHLRILSGFYGALSPLDGVTSYRLEMQAPLRVDGKKDLYEFWGDRLYKEVIDEDRTILNLASKEYSKSIEKYLQSEDRFVTFAFAELVNGKVKQKATFAKMARGEMVAFMAQHQIEDLEKTKEFSALGFSFSEEHSNEKLWTFLR